MCRRKRTSGMLSSAIACVTDATGAGAAGRGSVIRGSAGTRAVERHAASSSAAATIGGMARFIWYPPARLRDAAHGRWPLVATGGGYRPRTRGGMPTARGVRRDAAGGCDLVRSSVALRRQLGEERAQAVEARAQLGIDVRDQARRLGLARGVRCTQMLGDHRQRALVVA